MDDEAVAGAHPDAARPLSPPDGPQQRLRQFEQVTDVSLAHLDVEDLLGELLERVCDLLEVDTSAVLLLDTASSELVATAARGIEEEVRQGVRVPLQRGFAGRIAAEKRPIVLERVDETTVVNPLLQAKGIESMLGVPLLAEGEVVGVLHVGSLEPRVFVDADVDLLQVVADRVVSATRPRLVAVERDAALALQRGLLPAGLPEVPGLGLAARYVPGGGGSVGGDWYDVFRLGRGRLGVAIGDVSGHGLHAAVVMGRARSALRAYAIESVDPADVLSRLDAKLLHFEAGEMATALYAVLDPSFGRLEISCAGHLPPLLVTADSGASYIEVSVDPPLGVKPGLRRTTTTLDLPPGGFVCLYTDGLVEHRSDGIDVGMERLRSLPAARGAETACAQIMEQMVGTTVVEDDVALLVVHRLAEDQEPLVLHLPADPRSLAGMRSAARNWMLANGVGDEDASDILLAVNEASSNAIEHAYGPEGGTLDLRFERQGASVVVTVRDQGRWREARGSHRGRGTMLMEQVSDELRVDHRSDGTTVTIRRTVDAGAGGDDER